MRRWTALGIALCALVAGCGRPSETLLERVPRLGPEMARHLVEDDPAEFRTYAQRVGRRQLASAKAYLDLAVPSDSLDEFLRVERELEPYQRRIAETALSVFGDDVLRTVYDGYWARTAAERLGFVRTVKECATAIDHSLPAPVRAAAIEDIVARAESYRGIINCSDLYGTYASLLNELGRRDETPVYLKRGIDMALDFRDFTMASQLLGSLGDFYRQDGDFESMRDCWDRAIAYARRDNSWQEARILSFYAAHYRSRGQLGIARDLLLEAQDRCRELDASETEIRFVLDAMSFFGQMECWDVVGRGLRRAELVLEEGRAKLGEVDELRLEETRLQVLRAQYEASAGRCAVARTLALDAAGKIDGWTLGPHRTVRIGLGAARALSRCGLHGEARPLLERYDELCRNVPVLDQAEEVARELGRTALELGDPAVCAAMLALPPPPVGSVESLRRGVLQLRLAAGSGNEAAAFRALQSVLAQLDAWQHTGGGSIENDIEVAANDELRQIGHDLLAGNPEAGYAFELLWRAPARGRGRFGAPDATRAAFINGLARIGRESCKRLAARDAIHCVYDVRDDRVFRFTAGSQGVVLERLASGAVALRSLVEAACRRLANERSHPTARQGSRQPARSDDRPLQDVLGELGTALLPEAARQRTGPSLLLITAGGWLGHVPFETLPIAHDVATPILTARDVARVRSWRARAASRAPEAALIVAEPTYSASLRRRYSVLTERLPLGAAEAAYVQSLWPSSRLLTGDAATKRRLVEGWEDARLLYFAGHVVQDPQVPWVTFLPMAEAEDGHEDDSYLEVADVRSADLSGCRLAVLSSCASGASYAAGQVDAPSLADAFVDAGVQAVVSTRWAVQDAVADRTMRAFMRQIAAGDSDPTRALGRVRRELMRAEADPHTWAVFSITLGDIPGERAVAVQVQDQEEQ